MTDTIATRAADPATVVWWLSPDQVDDVATLVDGGVAVTCRPEVASELWAMVGSDLSGRVWRTEGVPFPEDDIDFSSWPRTTAALTEYKGGVALLPRDVPTVARLGGLFTDLEGDLLDPARFAATRVPALVLDGVRWLARLGGHEARRLGVTADGRRLPAPDGAEHGYVRRATLDGLWAALTDGLDVPGLVAPDPAAVAVLESEAVGSGFSWVGSLEPDDATGAHAWDVRLVDEVAGADMPPCRAATLDGALRACLDAYEADPGRVTVERAGHQIPDWLSSTMRDAAAGRPQRTLSGDPRIAEIRRRTVILKENAAADQMRAYAVERDPTPDLPDHVRLVINGHVFRAGVIGAERLARDLLAAVGVKPREPADHQVPTDPDLETLRTLAAAATKGELSVGGTHWGFVGLDAKVDPLDWDGGLTINGSPHFHVLSDDRKGLTYEDARFLVACWNSVKVRLGLL